MNPKAVWPKQWWLGWTLSRGTNADGKKILKWTETKTGRVANETERRNLSGRWIHGKWAKKWRRRQRSIWGMKMGLEEAKEALLIRKVMKAMNRRKYRAWNFLLDKPLNYKYQR